MRYELIDEELGIWARIDDDGKCRLTCNSEHPELVAWLAEHEEESLAE